MIHKGILALWAWRRSSAFAAQMGVTVPTLMNLEKGAPVVGMAVFIRALSVLGVEKKVAEALIR